MHRLGVTPDQLARRIHFGEDDLRAVLCGTVPTAAELSSRLAKFFATTNSFWLTMQTHYDQLLGVDN